MNVSMRSSISIWKRRALDNKSSWSKNYNQNKLFYSNSTPKSMKIQRLQYCKSYCFLGSHSATTLIRYDVQKSIRYNRGYIYKMQENSKTG